MEKSQFPKRNERYKNKWKEGPPTMAMVLGLTWILIEIKPDQWKSNWFTVPILVLPFFISNKFEKIKLPSLLKWGISLSVYGIGLVFFLTRH